MLSKYYYDRCMPMGCASSCKTFEIISSATEWTAKNLMQIKFMIYLLDDFLLVSSTFNTCQVQLENFLALCNYLGISMAPVKTIRPSSVLSFRQYLHGSSPSANKLKKCISLVLVDVKGVYELNPRRPLFLT